LPANIDELAQVSGHTSARPALSDAAISPLAVEAVDLRQVAVHADEALRAPSTGFAQGC